MSELVPGLPPLPPPRPMGEHDWVRLLARIDGAIAAYERQRQRRLVLALAVVLVLVVAVLSLAQWRSTSGAWVTRGGAPALVTDGTSRTLRG